MSAKSTWSLVFVAASVFALIFFFERPYRKLRSQSPETHVLPGFNITNVSSVQIQPSDQVDLRVDFTNASWQLTRPIAYSADRRKVNAFLQALAQLTWQGHISAVELQSHTNALEEFGFDNPQFSIALQEGGNRRYLRIGKKMTVGEQLFVQVIGADGFYIIDSELVNLMPRSQEDWRNHNLANWNEIFWNTDTVRAKAGNNSFELRFNPTNFLWRMAKPLETRANNPRINDLLQKISTNQISQFVSDDTSPDLEKFGLQTPELEITFAQGTNELFALQVGQSPTNNPSQVFARQRHQNNIFLIPKEPLAAWRLPYTDFRERHLASLPEKAIDHIEINGEDDFVLSKQTNGLWSVSGQTFTADTDLVEELLARVNLAEIEVEKNVVTDFTSYGLEKPLLHYTLQVSHVEPTNQLRADPITQIDFGTNNGRIFAHRSDESSVYSIKLEDFQFFPRASWQMRDRQVWNFDATNIINVVIHQKGQSRQFIRNAKNDWIIAPGSQGELNPASFEEALYRLGQLKAVFWTARGDASLERYGFKTTDHQISLQLKQNGKIESLDLELGGMSEFQHPYAAVVLNGEKLIFEFPWPLYYDFVLRDLTILPESPSRAP